MEERSQTNCSPCSGSATDSSMVGLGVGALVGRLVNLDTLAALVWRARWLGCLLREDGSGVSAMAMMLAQRSWVWLVWRLRLGAVDVPRSC